jgi:hypothetical protein
MTSIGRSTRMSAASHPDAAWRTLMMASIYTGYLCGAGWVRAVPEP